MVEGHENIKMSNSIVDYVFRALGLEYLNRTDIVQVPPKDTPVQETQVVKPVQETQVVKPVQETQVVEPVQDAEISNNSRNSESTAIAQEVQFVTKVEEVEITDKTETVANSVTTVQEVLGDMMGDAPACPDCGHITIRNGSCYKCLNCGNSLGCS